MCSVLSFAGINSNGFEEYNLKIYLVRASVCEEVRVL
jgi:hypothetical protein